MKLHGQISIDLPAGDYFALADHRKLQYCIYSHLLSINGRYGRDYF